MGIPRSQIELNSSHFNTSSGREVSLREDGTFDFSSATVTFATPSANNSPATKAYVDAIASGGKFYKDPVKTFVESSDLPAYTASGSGEGKTITIDANGAFPSQNGVSILLNDRVLVADSSGGASADHGIYTLTQVGSVGTPAILTRSADADTNEKVGPGLYVFVDQGTNYADTAWVISTNGPITLDTTNITFTKFSRLQELTAGNGISKSGTAVSVNLAASNPCLEFNSAGLQVKVDGDDVISRGSSGLGITLDGGTLAKSGSGLKVATSGISANELATNAVTPAKLSWRLEREYFGDTGWSYSSNINSRSVLQTPATDTHVLEYQELLINGVALGPDGTGQSKRVTDSPAADGEWRLNGTTLEVYASATFASSGHVFSLAYPR